MAMSQTFAARPMWHPSGMRQSQSLPSLSVPVDDALRMQSVRIPESAKYKEMSNFLQSDDHFQRMIGRNSRHDPKLQATAAAPRGHSLDPTPSELKAASLRARDTSVESRINWQDGMNSCINRLMCDLDLGLGKPHDLTSHRSRVKLMDEAYSWYTKVGQKQARKSRPGASYLVFHQDDPPDAGSLRKYDNSVARWRTPAQEAALLRAANSGISSRPDEEPAAAAPAAGENK